MRKMLLILLAAILLLAYGCGDGGSEIPETSLPETEPQGPETVGSIEEIENMGTVIFVRPDADASVADGSNETPYADINSAFSAAKKLLDTAKKDAPVTVTVVLADGVHVMNKTATIMAKSMTNSAYATLNVVANEGASPVVTGAQAIDTARFVKVEGTEYYLYQFEADENGTYPVFRDLYVDGALSNIATSSSYPCRFAPSSTSKGMYVNTEAASLLPQDDLADAEYFLTAEWEYYVLHVDGVDASDTKSYGQTEHSLLKLKESELSVFLSTLHPSISMSNNGSYAIRNHPVYIDEGNEYAYDHKTGRLWYRPADGKSITDADISFGSLDVLFRFRGLSNVTVQGITFTGTTCTQIPKKGFLSAQANGDKRDGYLSVAAVVSMETTNLTVRDCTFAELGTCGLMLRNRTSGAKIVDCDFRNVAMSAISVGEHSATWSNTTATTNLEIANNLVENIAFQYPSSVAIYVGMVDGARIHHNTVRNVAYSGFNIGWGWDLAKFKHDESICVNNTEVAYNYIERYMQVCRDGGAIYILGSNGELDFSDYINFLHDNYAVIEGADSNQRGFYLDGVTSNWHVYDNVSLGCAYSLFIQCHAGDMAHNVLAERNYADRYTPTNNHAPGRNVIVKDMKVSTDLFTAYPEAKAIADASGRRS